MNKFIPILLLAPFLVFVTNEAFAVDCEIPHCYVVAFSPEINSDFGGLKYEIDTPDLHIDSVNCDDIAVSTGWLAMRNGFEWMEAGVTTGTFNGECETLTKGYYAYQYIISGKPVYTEILLNRLDPGEDKYIEITKDSSGVSMWFDDNEAGKGFPNARLSFGFDVVDAEFGIEGTVPADSEYSSIPMSKFTNVQYQTGDGIWRNLPSSTDLFDSSTSEGYIGEMCGSGAFVAGTVMDTDCNVIAVKNSAPIVVSNNDIKIDNDDKVTITLDDNDTDKDYLQYTLTRSPTRGSFDSGIGVGDRIPTIDGDTSRLFYTPDSNPPVSDVIEYSVTDSRSGHSRSGLIIFDAPTPVTVPDPIDDLRFTLSGTDVNFRWNPPNDNGSEITSYWVSSSRDLDYWQDYDVFSEDTTSFTFSGYEGYDRYWKVLAKSSLGYSPSSNIVHVHIDDTTPPVITIENPSNGKVITDPIVVIEGTIVESDITGIENIQIKVDGILNTDPINIEPVSADYYYNFDAQLSGMSNGPHIITVHADNGDGFSGSSSVTITMDVPVPVQLDSFEDTFQTDMSNWFLTTEDDEYWSIKSPLVEVPDSEAGNTITGTEDCDVICSMSMLDYVDLNGMEEPTLEFYRYVSTDVIGDEGIYLYTSIDGGDTWDFFDSYTEDRGRDSGDWELHSYPLNTFNTSQFKIKFDAKSSGNSDDTQIDNVRIFDDIVIPDTMPPTITVPDNYTAEATAILTPLDNTHYGTATVTDDNDPSPNITNDAPATFPLGDTIITYTATDNTEKTSTATQTITIQDMTAPEITAPENYSHNTITDLTELTSDDFGVATAIDIFGVTITNDAPTSFPLGDTVIEWTATDDNDNSVIAYQTVTLVDSAHINTITDTEYKRSTYNIRVYWEDTVERTPIDYKYNLAHRVLDSGEEFTVIPNYDRPFLNAPYPSDVIIEYKIRINPNASLYADGDESAWSDVYTIPKLVIDTPSNLRYEFLDNGDIKIDWDAPILTEYLKATRVYVSSTPFADGKNYQYGVVDPSITTFTINGGLKNNEDTYVILMARYGLNSNYIIYEVMIPAPTVIPNLIQKIIADDGTRDDFFGFSISIDGNTALIGATWDGDNGSYSGSAYIFEKVDGAWTQTAKLLPDDGAADDFFGYSVSIDGNTALIGAHGDDDNGSSSGSAYIFEKIDGAWTQTAKLLPDDGAADDRFGFSVSIDGNTALIGAYRDDDNGSSSGSVYIFEKVDGAWTQTAKLLPDDGTAGDVFGYSVSIDGNTALIGAHGDDDNGSSSGSVYIFEKIDEIWTQTAKLLPDDGAAYDVFGGSISIDGNTALIGANWDDDNGSSSGSAYIFEKIDETWTQTVKLLPDDGTANDRFGFSVSIDGNTALIGAYRDDDNGSYSGSAYIFEKIDETWTQTAKLLPDDGAADDLFGGSVSIDGNTALIGAYRDDDNGSFSGSAYIFSGNFAEMGISSDAIPASMTSSSASVAPLMQFSDTLNASQFYGLISDVSFDPYSMNIRLLDSEKFIITNTIHNGTDTVIHLEQVPFYYELDNDAIPSHVTIRIYNELEWNEKTIYTDHVVSLEYAK